MHCLSGSRAFSRWPVGQLQLLLMIKTGGSGKREGLPAGTAGGTPYATPTLRCVPMDPSFLYPLTLSLAFPRIVPTWCKYCLCMFWATLSEGYFSHDLILCNYFFVGWLVGWLAGFNTWEFFKISSLLLALFLNFQYSYWFPTQQYCFGHFVTFWLRMLPWSNLCKLLWKPKR